MIGYALAAAAIYYAWVKLQVGAADFRMAMPLVSWTNAAMALGMFVLHGLMNAVAFGHLLRMSGGLVPVSTGVQAWTGSLLAKYVPGGVWQVVGRGVLLAERAVPATVVVKASVIEQALSTGSCVLIIVIASAVGAGMTWVGWASVVGIAAVFLVLPALVRAPGGREHRADYRRSIALYFISMLPYAAGYVVIASPDHIAEFVAQLFEATVAGLLMVLSPGGLGIRESWMAVQWQEGGGELFALLLLVRAVLLASEVLLVVVAGLYFGRHPVAGAVTPASEDVRLRITVAGTGARGSGYPNAEQTVRLLRERTEWEIRDEAAWLPEGASLWTAAGGGRTRLLAWAARLAWGNLLAAMAVLLRCRRASDWVYVPYPAVFLMWWLSWVPRFARPRTVVDAFISVWDSAFRDRALLRPAGVLSRLVRWFEARALSAADVVLVDTVANKRWMVDELALREERISAVPLAIAAKAAVQESSGFGDRTPGVIRVLYFGTLVPLHGIAVVADAIRRLCRTGEFHFELVGDGQDRKVLEDLLREVPEGAVTWILEWQSSAQLALRIRTADVCLGVFGGAGKASRVFPFKAYLSLSEGTPVVTQVNFSLPEGAPSPPVVAVQANADDLAKALLRLARDEALRNRLSIDSLTYFKDYLGPGRIAAAWRQALDGVRD